MSRAQTKRPQFGGRWRFAWASLPASSRDRACQRLKWSCIGRCGIGVGSQSRRSYTRRPSTLQRIAVDVPLDRVLVEVLACIEAEVDEGWGASVAVLHPRALKAGVVEDVDEHLARVLAEKLDVDLLPGRVAMQEEPGDQSGRPRRADVGYKLSVPVFLAAAKCARREVTDWRTFPAKRQSQCLIGLEGDVAGCEEGKVAWERVVSERPVCVVDAGEVVVDLFAQRRCFLFLGDADALPPL